MADLQHADPAGSAAGNKDHDKSFKVEISYTGQQKEFTVKPDELVKTLLDKALQAFGPIAQQHTLALFNEKGQELKDDHTLEQSGVNAEDDDLLLKPSAVRAG